VFLIINEFQYFILGHPKNSLILQITLKGNNMEMKLEDLDIDDVGLDEDVTPGNEFDEDTYEKPWLDGSAPQDEEVHEEVHEDEPTNEPEEEDIIVSLLKDKGINPEAIKFENEAGEIEEKSFNELSREEQLQILNYDESDDDFGLAEDEVSLINELRASNLSADEYKKYIAQQAIQEYLDSNQEDTPVYEIDSIPDDELYLIDLKAKVPELTEEDASAELELAKQNEALYQKKVQGIRNEYKKKEELLAQQEEEEQRLAAEKAAQEFEDTIVAAIQENDTIDLGESSLTLSEDDMNEIASFILDSDVAGVRHIAKALNDPKTLVGMVWYALKGQEAFSQITDYYKQKITEASKYNYNKGFEDAKGGKAPNAAKTVVKKTAGSTAAPAKKVITIDDLD
jgi:hypothetical protein